MAVLGLNSIPRWRRRGFTIGWNSRRRWISLFSPLAPVPNPACFIPTPRGPKASTRRLLSVCRHPAFYLAKLNLVVPGIVPVARQQFFVRAALHDFAVLQHQNAGRPSGRRKPVRNDK